MNSSGHFIKLWRMEMEKRYFYNSKFKEYLPLVLQNFPKDLTRKNDKYFERLDYIYL